MNIQDIVLIYDYNFWANGRILTTAASVSREQFSAPASFPYGGLRGTLLHILEAEMSWRLRYEGMSWPGDLVEADFPTLAAVQAAFQAEEQSMREYLAHLGDDALIKPVTYPIGEPPGTRSRILWHCLYHVVNHGMQHRSEAAAMLTDFGHSPGDLDFVDFIKPL